LLLLFGNVLIAFGVSVFSRASLGFDPFMIFASGVAKNLGIDLGFTHILINLALALIYLLIGKKKYIHIGTLLAMTLTGPLIDVFTRMDQLLLPGEIDFAIRIVLVLAICPLIGLGVYLYTGVRLGAGPNDLAAIILSDATKKPFGVVRVLVDGAWTVAGILLGGSIGIGTLLSLLLVGSSVQLYSKLKLFTKYITIHTESNASRQDSF
jgi:uncharacterized protein